MMEKHYEVFFEKLAQDGYYGPTYDSGESQGTSVLGRMAGGAIGLAAGGFLGRKFGSRIGGSLVKNFGKTPTFGSVRSGMRMGKKIGPWAGAGLGGLMGYNVMQ